MIFLKLRAMMVFFCNHLNLAKWPPNHDNDDDDSDDEDDDDYGDDEDDDDDGDDDDDLLLPDVCSFDSQYLFSPPVTDSSLFHFKPPDNTILYNTVQYLYNNVQYCTKLYKI